MQSISHAGPENCQLLFAGILIPAMAVGAACGRVIGMMVQALISSWGFADIPVSLPSYAVCPPSSTSQHFHLGSLKLALDTSSQNQIQTQI